MLVAGVYYMLPSHTILYVNQILLVAFGHPCDLDFCSLLLKVIWFILKEKSHDSRNRVGLALQHLFVIGFLPYIYKLIHAEGPLTGKQARVIQTWPVKCEAFPYVFLP